MTNQTITHNGVTLTLTQEPYIDTVHLRVGDTVEVINGTVYRASAVDTDGNAYQVYWTRLDDNNEVTDWSAYTVVDA
jgi:hypothetical protein